MARITLITFSATLSLLATLGLAWLMAARLGARRSATERQPAATRPSFELLMQ